MTTHSDWKKQQVFKKFFFGFCLKRDMNINGNVCWEYFKNHFESNSSGAYYQQLLLLVAVSINFNYTG